MILPPWSVVFLLGIKVYPGCMEMCFMSAVIMIPTWILITHHMDRLQHSTNRTKPIGGVFCTDGCVTTIEGPRLYRVSWHEKQRAKTTLPETNSKSPSEMMTRPSSLPDMKLTIKFETFENRYILLELTVCP